MPKGGARPGAGRKPGGQKVNKEPSQREIAREEVKKVMAGAKSPLAVLCEIAADESRDPTLRVQAASSVMPFLYPRLSATVTADVSDKVNRPTQSALLDKLSQQFARLALPGEIVDVMPEPVALIETD